MGRQNDRLRMLDWRTRAALVGVEVGRRAGGQGRPRPPALEFHHVPAHLVRPDPRVPLRVGRIAAETDPVPAAWVERCRALTEVWVPSRFNAVSFEAAGVEPWRLKVLPLGVDTALFHPPSPGDPRPPRLVGARGFKFLSVLTWQRRKGWDLLVRAFVEEFGPGENVSLVLKTAPFGAAPALGPAGAPAGEAPRGLRDQLARFVAEELGRDPSKTPPITVIEAALARDRLASVYRACDAFVLPSRGEGLGRPYLEAMATGLPTIGTAWGGNLDFMTPTNSYLIDIEGLEPAECLPGVGPARTAAGAASGAPPQWARPSVAHLRELMRRVFSQCREGAIRGERARQDIRAGWEERVTCEAMAAGLRRLLSSRAERGRPLESSAPGGSPDPSRSRALVSKRQHQCTSRGIRCN